jgi:DNA (cytosine-5)-methyltransferase 1
MKHGSLFSGIGGFDLAAEWMGWENVFHCEWNPFGQKVLKHYWPKAELFNDITKSDFTKYANTIDILTGGFPCQPYSAAGKRLGKEDERHLWPEMLRAIQEISPRYIVGENVRGLLNWNGGMVFDEVCVELENIGYQVAPVVIPACGVGAPHTRERIWFVAANPARKSSERLQFKQRKNSNEKQREFGRNCGEMGDGIIANTESSNVQNEWIEFKVMGKENIRKQAKGFEHGNIPKNWHDFPIESPVCGGDDGLPIKLDGITFPRWRTESIKAYGNAIVPQVAFEIFKAIQQCDDTML